MFMFLLCILFGRAFITTLGAIELEIKIYCFRIFKINTAASKL